MLSWAQRGGCRSVDDDPTVGPSSHTLNKRKRTTKRKQKNTHPMRPFSCLNGRIAIQFISLLLALAFCFRSPG